MWIAWALLVVAVIAAMLVVSGLAVQDPWSSVELGQLPRSDIARAPGDARVRIVGRVRTFGAPLSAPPDGSACIGYQVIIEELQRHAGGLVAESTWVAVAAEFDVADFWIEDDTGVALVEARGGADLRLRRDRFGVVEDLGDRRHVRVTLGDGDRIAVCGFATWDADPAEGTMPPVIELPEVIGRRLVLHARPRQPIVISDEPPLMVES